MNGGRLIVRLAEKVDAHQRFPLADGDTRALQKVSQASVGEHDTLLVIGQDASIENVDADGRVGEPAHEVQTTEVVDVAVGDQDGGDVGQ